MCVHVHTVHLPTVTVGTMFQQQSNHLLMAISHSVMQWSVILIPRNVDQGSTTYQQFNHFQMAMITGLVLRRESAHHNMTSKTIHSVVKI